jgi:hypothetical protein
MQGAQWLKTNTGRECIDHGPYSKLTYIFRIEGDEGLLLKCFSSGIICPFLYSLCCDAQNGLHHHFLIFRIGMPVEAMRRLKLPWNSSWH